MRKLSPKNKHTEQYAKDAKEGVKILKKKYPKLYAGLKKIDEKQLRIFDTGGMRSSGEGKIEYFGFRHPLCELSFGKYMHKHQTCEDGSKRTSDNWWKGWDENVSIQSMVRHIEDLQAIEAGYRVFKVKHFGGEETIYSPDITDYVEIMKGQEVTKEDCYNAIRFNADAGKLQHLKDIHISQ